MFESNRSPHSTSRGNQPYECILCGATTMGENIDERGSVNQIYRMRIQRSREDETASCKESFPQDDIRTFHQNCFNTINFWYRDLAMEEFHADKLLHVYSIPTMPLHYVDLCPLIRESILDFEYTLYTYPILA